MSTLEAKKTSKAKPQGLASNAIVRAFRVDVKDWTEATSIVRTISPSRAKFLAWNSAKEAGYNLPFGRFLVKRAPKHDHNTSLIAGRCYGIDHVEDKFM
jgi:hypothetical protein